MDHCRQRPPVCHRYQAAAELLGRRWSAAVIRATMEGPARFTEIRSSVDGLSARLLTEQAVLDLTIEEPPIEDVIELVFAQEREQ